MFRYDSRIGVFQPTCRRDRLAATRKSVPVALCSEIRRKFASYSGDVSRRHEGCLRLRLCPFGCQLSPCLLPGSRSCPCHATGKTTGLVCPVDAVHRQLAEQLVRARAVAAPWAPPGVRQQGYSLVTRALIVTMSFPAQDQTAASSEAMGPSVQSRRATVQLCALPTRLGYRRRYWQPCTAARGHSTPELTPTFSAPKRAACPMDIARKVWTPVGFFRTARTPSATAWQTSIKR
jgi:hypothetical protein